MYICLAIKYVLDKLIFKTGRLYMENGVCIHMDEPKYLYAM